MPSVPRTLLLAVGLLRATAPLAAQASAGGPPPAVAALGRALDLENANKYRDAIMAYREALGDPEQVVPAMLGLERCWSQLGAPDSLLPVLDSTIARRPKDPTLRSIQLRTLSATRRDEDLRRAFDQWVAQVPQDATPYREFARLLLEDNRARAADTLLQEATRVLGSSRELSAELAQLRAALGLWSAAAASWREALWMSPYLDQAAVFSLLPVPPAFRDSVRGPLLAEPIELAPRKVLAALELRWRSPRDGWRALSQVPVRDSTVTAWIEFAEDAEANEAWLTARDAFAAALPLAKRRELAIRAATNAMQGGDPASVLALLAGVGKAAGDTSIIGSAVLLQARALGALARPQEADSLLQARGAALDPLARGQAYRAVAWGWVRVGDLARARAALAETQGEDEGQAEAWIALYEGNLKAARGGLRRTDETTHDAVLAMSLLSRTRVDSSLAIGAAFLSLARADTLLAARQFERVAADVPEVTPLLLGIAARLYAVRDTAAAVRLWQGLVEQWVAAPEAAEAELEWARVLRKQGDGAAARVRLEHLILTWPQSALVPQARRELELARAAGKSSGD